MLIELGTELAEVLWRTSPSRSQSFVVTVQLRDLGFPDDYASNYPATPARELIFECRELGWSYAWYLEGAWQETPRAEARAAGIAAARALLELWSDDPGGDGDSPDATDGTPASDTPDDSTGDAEADPAPDAEPVETYILREVSDPDRQRMEYLARECERLLGVAAHLVESGAWRSDPAIEFDVDVLRQSLRNELYPPTERAPMLGTVSGAVLQLSSYILGVADLSQDEASPASDAAGWISSNLVRPLVVAEGTPGLSPAAEEAAAALGRVADWTVPTANLPSPLATVVEEIASSDEQSRTEFVSTALFEGRTPRGIVSSIADGVGAAGSVGTVGVIVGGAIGTAVGCGLGLPTVDAMQSSGLVGSTVGGTVGVVLGTLIALLAARFRWAVKPSQHSDGSSPREAN